jgi:hypothetical protein
LADDRGVIALDCGLGIGGGAVVMFPYVSGDLEVLLRGEAGQIKIILG